MKILGAVWPDSLAKSVISRFNEEHCTNKTRLRANGTPCKALLFTCVCIDMHACVLAYAFPYT